MKWKGGRVDPAPPCRIAGIVNVFRAELRDEDFSCENSLTIMSLYPKNVVSPGVRLHDKDLHLDDNSFNCVILVRRSSGAPDPPAAPLGKINNKHI